MNLVANSMTFEHRGDDGYSFTVVAVYDPESGWSASVSMRSDGFKTAEAAIKHLRHSAASFLRALEDMDP